MTSFSVVGLSDDFAREYLDNLISAEEHAYAKRGIYHNWWNDEIQTRDMHSEKLYFIFERMTNIEKIRRKILEDKPFQYDGENFSDFDGSMPGVLRFGKRSSYFEDRISKKEASIKNLHLNLTRKRWIS